MARSTTGIDLTGDGQNLVACLMLIDRLGNVTGYTEHDQVLAHDLGDTHPDTGLLIGSINYQPEASFFRKVFEARAGGRTGSGDLEGMIDSAGITEDAILAKLYDAALFKLFLLDWTDPTAGRIHIEIGEMEETHIEEDRLTVTMRSLLDRFHTTKIGDYYEAECIHSLGSMPIDIPPPFGKIGCQVQLDPTVWEAGLVVTARGETNAKPPTTSESPSEVNTVQPTVQNGRFFEAQNSGTTVTEPSWNTTLGGTTVHDGITWIARQALRQTYELEAFSSQSVLTVTYPGDAPVTWWQRARVLGAVGLNAGLSRHVKSITQGSPDNELTITLWTPFPLAFEIGSPNDSFTLIKGCDKIITTCLNDFRNIENNGAFAVFAPTTDEVFKIPKIQPA